MANFDNTQVETRTGIDPTYLPSTTRRLSDTIDATQYLMEASPEARKPDWFDSLVFRVDRGVRHEEVPFVENVRGIGRYRIRQLRRYVEADDVLGAGELDGESLWARLQSLLDEIGNPDQFEDVLKGNVTGIGPATARGVRKFVERADVSPTYDQTGEFGGVRPEPEPARNGNGFSKATRLDDFR